MEIIFRILILTWHYTKEASPWLLTGFLFAGFLKAFVPSEILLKYLGGKNIGSILRAALVGIPLPLCSCGIIPTGIGMYKQGASVSSTLAFFISTPATTITAIILSFGMIGSKFTVIWIAACFSIALLVGILSLVFIKDKVRGLKNSIGKGHTFKIQEIFNCNDCRDIFLGKIKEIFRYGFVEMVEEIGVYLFIGLLAAGIISALIPSDFIGKNLGGGLLPLLVIVLISTPMYVCSTASIPFVASLVAKGMHPALGIAFLIAGPATNISPVLAIGKVMGKKTALLYLISIVIFSILTAFILEFFKIL